MENEEAKKAEVERIKKIREYEEKLANFKMAVALTIGQLEECFGSFKIGTCNAERAAFFIEDILDGEFSHVKWVD